MTAAKHLILLGDSVFDNGVYVDPGQADVTDHLRRKIELKGWSIEVKRAKVFRGDWWTQAAAQAVDRKEKPVLVYRLDRHDWRAMVCLCDISEYELHDRVDMEFRTWIYIVREQL